MGDLSIRRWHFLLVIGAVLCAAGTWLYANRVLVPNIIAYDIEHGLPHGNNSDLYPRWLGARELLLHGRDPYTMEITREIQTGMYGIPLPPDKYGAGKNYQQGFYYPVYVAFMLVANPRSAVREGEERILLGILRAYGVHYSVWLRLLHWPLPLWMQATCVIFIIGSVPIMQGLKLEQMTLVRLFR